MAAPGPRAWKSSVRRSLLCSPKSWGRRPVEKALAAPAEGLALAHARGECGFTSELYRLRGELLMDRAGDDAARRAEAVGCFEQAVDVASRQGARALELRALRSWNRLCGDDGFQLRHQRGRADEKGHGDVSDEAPQEKEDRQRADVAALRELLNWHERGARDFAGRWSWWRRSFASARKKWFDYSGACGLPRNARRCWSMLPSTPWSPWTPRAG